MKIEFGPFIFSVTLIPLLAFLCLLPLFISLGFWQLGRAEEKQVLLEMHGKRINQVAIRRSAGINDDIESLRYRKVLLTGQYDEAHQFLVDNQIFEGRAGYFVMTPFLFDNQDKAMLVNRGWLPSNPDRSILPEVTIQDLEQTISGRIDRFPSVGIQLEGAEIPSKGWPSVVQVVDSQEIAKKLQYPVFGFQIQLDKELADGYGRDWKSAMVTMPPEKHIAYAFQWFALALTLVILFIWLNINKRN